MTAFVMTDHALRRGVEMRVAPHEIRNTIHHPEMVLHSEKHGCDWYTCGRLTAATRTDEDGTIVVTTLLWASENGWKTDPGLASDRGLRHAPTPIDLHRRYGTGKPHAR